MTRLENRHKSKDKNQTVLLYGALLPCARTHTYTWLLPFQFLQTFERDLFPTITVPGGQHFSYCKYEL
jgi:hypothetical protein